MYADTFHADPKQWWFLTGPEKAALSAHRDALPPGRAGQPQPTARAGANSPSRTAFTTRSSTPTASCAVSTKARRKRAAKAAARHQRLSSRGWVVIDVPVNEARTPPSAIAAIIAVSAGRQPVPFLADLFSSARRCRRHPSRIPPRTQCAAQRAGRRRAGDRLRFHSRKKCQCAPGGDVHRLRLLVRLPRRLHHELSHCTARCISMARAISAGFISRCSSPTSSSPSRACR